MENVKQVVQKTIALLIIITMIIVQYAIVGFTAITYAIDFVSTNNDNVQFKAYFVEQENETAIIERSIDSKDLKLNIDVSVKNEGYFNGNISLENAGFKLKDVFKSDYIREVKDNVIYLNQINAEDTAHLEIGIEFIDGNEIPLSALSSESRVKLQGTYFYSKKNETINAISNVVINWNIPQNTKAEILSKILTNKTYTINEQNKKIVQFLVSSKLTNNNYPTKNTKLHISVPEGVTNVEVHKRTTKATNGEKDFTQGNYKVENNILEINVDNNEVDGKISWIKGFQDVFVITYEFDENKDLSNANITVNGTITTFDKNSTTGADIALNGEQSQIDLSKEEDGVISVDQEEKENSIYKGKIYSGENREITSDTIVYVDYANATQEFTVTENIPLFTYEETDDEDNKKTITKEANVEYKSIKINKIQLSAVLGDAWNLKIGDKTITNETQSDENGDIIIALNQGTKTVDIKASKPIKNGAFLIESTKTLLKTEYTREEINKFTNLEDSSSVQYNSYKYTHSFIMNLKETESKADFKCEQQALMSNKEGHELNMTVVLESKNESQDLYKNPTLKIILPKQIINVKSNQLPQLRYSNGLELTEKNYTIDEENGQKVIIIKLTGEQTGYLGEAIQGVTIPIKLSVDTDEITKDTEEEIVLTYTNENAKKYTDQGTQKEKIQIITNVNQNQEQEQNEGENQPSQNNSQQTYEERISSDIKAYVGGEEIKKGEEIKAGEIVQYELKITNNSNEDINNLGLNITIPDEATLLEYNPEYPRQNPEQDGAYYEDGDIFSKKENKLITEQGISIKAGKTYIYKYMTEINTNLREKKNIETNAIIKKDENIISNLKIENNISPASLKVSLKPLFRKYGEELEAKKNYEYKLEIQNLTNTDQNNVKVKIIKNDVVEITKMSLVNEIISNESDSEDIQYEEEIDNNINDDKDRIEEITDDENIDNENIDDEDLDVVQDDLIIDQIPVNKKAEIVINTINKQISDEVVYSLLSANAEDSSSNIYRSNRLEEKVKGLRISATLEKNVTTEQQNNQVKSGDIIKYILKIKNTGYLDCENLEIVDYFSKYLTLKSLKLNGNNYEYNIEPMIGKEYNYNQLNIETSLKSKDEAIIEIIGEVNEDLPDEKKLMVINKATITGDGVKLFETEKMTNIIEQEDSNSESENNPGENIEDENNEGENNEGENIDNENNNNNEEDSYYNKYAISGIAWLDENENGKRDENEKVLNDLTVKLFNLDNNINVSTKTKENGKYIFENIENGRYVVIFEYDTGKYMLTTYNANGVEESNNSDVENATMTIDGVNKKVAATDTLTINKNNLTNIDIGLKEAKVFDLELSKTISKVTVTNGSGTKTYNYNDVNLAKAEIKGKYLSGSIVLIEYKIRVTNNGDIAGYARKIVDYKPNDLEFNSEINSKWYKSGNNLYTNSLAETIINPGETKELTLILTKKMTNTNTGLTNNKAEIIEDYNVLGISDLDSTLNNKQENEDDMGQANIIISVSTGKTIGFIIITLIIAICIGILVFFNLKKIIYKSMNI